MPFSVRQSRPGLPLWRLPVPGAIRRGRRQASANRPVRWLPETEGLLWQYRVRELSAGCPAAMRRGTPPSRREPPCPMASRDRRAALAIPRARVIRRLPGGNAAGDAAKPARTALSDGFPRPKGCFWQYRTWVKPAGCPAQPGGGRSSGSPVGWSISRIGRIAGGAMALPRWFADGAQRLGGGAWQGWVWPWIAGVLLRPSCGCRD